MLLKQIVDTDYVNFKLPSMYLATCFCNWKCCKEANIPVTVCQNHPIAQMPVIEISADEILRRYYSNPLSRAFIFAGLEPFLQFDELWTTIDWIRRVGDCFDPVVIYTGYTPDEITTHIETLRLSKNIIVKFGRYRPNSPSHYDDVLGVTLASNNQFAQWIC